MLWRLRSQRVIIIIISVETDEYRQSRLDVRKFSFAVRVVKPSNSLREEVVTAPSVQAFEARLDKAWNDQPLKFHYKEDLIL